MDKQPQFHVKGKFNWRKTARITIEQRETEEPPPMPKLTENDTEPMVVLRETQEEVLFSEVEDRLWPEGCETQERQVIMVTAPDSTTEFVAFGLCQVVADYPWEVAFVARIRNADCESFKECMPESVPLAQYSAYTQIEQASLRNYLEQYCMAFTRQVVARHLPKRGTRTKKGYSRAV
jgi:hypothetical protein